MNALLDLSALGERAVPTAAVLPAGQIDFKPNIEDIPLGCGLLEETAPGVFVKSKTIRRSKKFRLTHRSLMNLVLKSYKAGVDGEELRA